MSDVDTSGLKNSCSSPALAMVLDCVKVRPSPRKCALVSEGVRWWGVGAGRVLKPMLAVVLDYVKVRLGRPCWASPKAH